MFTIAANALYTTFSRRGTTRQLTGAIITCAISALLLLPALIWFSMRFSVKQAVIPATEVGVALAYIALCGWLLPLGITVAYWLFTLPRSTNTGVHIPSQRGNALYRQTKDSITTLEQPPRSQPGVVAPYVFSEDKPWCWLEYRSGSFQGQRLALKRAIATIGRDENCDIWLDDDMASRHHAELAWHNGQSYLTDCESLNGVLLNGKAIHGSTPIASRDIIEVGTHLFLFTLTEQTEAEDDPLARHVWRSSLDSLNQSSASLPTTTQLDADVAHPATEAHQAMNCHTEKTADLPYDNIQLPVLTRRGTLTLLNSEIEGKSFSLNRPIITLGRGIECDIVLNDASISRWHAQFLRQPDGDYIQDLTSRNGTKVNNEALTTLRLLQPGDTIRVGTLQMAYASVQAERLTPLPATMLLQPQTQQSHTPTGSPLPSMLSGPLPLRLPSKPREQ